MKVMINSVHFKADQKLEDFITQKVEKLQFTSRLTKNLKTSSRRKWKSFARSTAR